MHTTLFSQARAEWRERLLEAGLGTYRPAPVRYATALAVMGLFVMLRVALERWTDAGNAFTLVFPAVVLAAWFGGIGPGLLASACGGAVAWYLWPDPPLSWTERKPADWVDLGFFAFSSLLISGLAAVLRRIVIRREQAQERFRVLLQSIGDAVIATDRGGRVLFLNRVAESLTGWTKEEAANSTLDEVFRVTYNPPGAKADAGGEFNAGGYLVMTSRDGRRYLIEDCTAAVRDDAGEIGGLVLVFRDVSGRRLAEQRLRESEARFRNLADAAPVLIWMADANASCEWCNRAWLEFTGRTLEQEIGHGWGDVMHRDDWAAAAAAYDEARRSKQAFEIEYRMRRADGVYRWMQGRGRPRLEGGVCVGFIGSCMDVTESREAKDGLKRHAEELEGWMAERTRELQEKVTELEAFSYSVSHDLRTPLRAIISYSGLLAERLRAQVPAEEFSYLERVHAAARRLDRMVLDILTYSSVARGPVVMGRVELESLLEQVMHLYPALQLVAIEVRRPLLPVLGHEAFLTQCFTNLLMNAAKFVAPGVEPRVVVRTETRGDRVRIWVEDNGVGIAERHQERIFRFFERLSSDLTSAGTGMGLPVVRKAAQRMGGSVGVESAPGAGSRFWIDLPAAPAERNGLEPGG